MSFLLDMQQRFSLIFIAIFVHNTHFIIIINGIDASLLLGNGRFDFSFFLFFFSFFYSCFFRGEISSFRNNDFWWDSMNTKG